ncbi:GNAT family N-acetyltransferase [Alicyclobacillus shizuokensis]|uniref:GNAT family N-acetyltransferase n=1 Tax=Alicyclobacillus shizuokensis TaxID=392014 RepID=UPI0008312A2D|nr:GNAT family N-acetyltransferase [Alicyclobacillus shizuokensis]MCL6625628.1 GNAT family N-acetyltransferase [Alicyclobacillus shizuokensis]
MNNSDDWEVLRTSDAAAVQELAAQLGWAFRRQQVLWLLTAGWVIGLRRGRQLLATAAVFAYPPTWASIGMVMVRPDVQRCGIGRRLVSVCLAYAQSRAACVSLLSTAPGYRLYESLGFETVGFIHRMQRPVGSDAASPSVHADIFAGEEAENGWQLARGVEVSPRHWPQIARLDQEANGAPRHHLFLSPEDQPDRQALRSLARLSIAALNREQQLVGTAVLVPRPGAVAIGPLLAESLDVAKSVTAAAERLETGMIRVDVPSAQTEFRRYLEQAGWQETMISPLMTWRGVPLPGRRLWLYGLLDPALG